MDSTYPGSYYGGSYIGINFIRGDVMAEVRVTTKKVVALILTEHESKWLKGVIQNPLNDNESCEDAEMRSEIFAALDGAGI